MRRSILALSVLPSALSMTIIDSHLHVWASQAETLSFPWLQDPPDHLKDKASVDALLQQMKEKRVDGALIVQPINHKFDHSYLIQAMKQHNNLKGMLLHDPSLSQEEAIQRLENLALQGFVGVRFNPYLWPKEGEKHVPMSSPTGLAVYRRCAELHLPVGVMCFQGIDLHYDDIVELLQKSPETKLILDHFGFTQTDAQFQQLLSLAKYPQVYVKTSALFRLLGDSYPYEKVRQERFLPLLKAFGSKRLLWGSDFPFVLDEPDGYSVVNLVQSWISDEEDRQWIMGRTAESLFGPWKTM